MWHLQRDNTRGDQPRSRGATGALWRRLPAALGAAALAALGVRRLAVVGLTALLALAGAGLAPAAWADPIQVTPGHTPTTTLTLSTRGVPDGSKTIVDVTLTSKDGTPLYGRTIHIYQYDAGDANEERIIGAWDITFPAGRTTVSAPIDAYITRPSTIVADYQTRDAQGDYVVDSVTRIYRQGNDPAPPQDPEPPAAPAFSTTTALSTTPNPSTVGQQVTLTAAVAGADGSAPEGTVFFLRRGTCTSPFPGGPSLAGGGAVCDEPFASAPLVNGVATVRVSDLPQGASDLSAGYAGATYSGGQYDGQAHYYPSTSNHVTQNVSAAPGSALRVAGSGTLPLGTENAAFTLDLTASGTSASGTCQLTGQTTSVRCTSFYEVKRSGSTVTFRGTGVYNNRQPISFTATVVDGSPDSFVIYGAGQRYGGNLTSGNITLS